MRERGRLTVRMLAGLVLLAALNLAFFQFLASFKGFWPQVAPMGVALQTAGLSLWWRRRRGRNYAFWDGFVACGGLAWLLMPSWWFLPDGWTLNEWYWYLHELVWHAKENVISCWPWRGWTLAERVRFCSDHDDAIEMIPGSLPLLAIGLSGGFLAWGGRRLWGEWIERIWRGSVIGVSGDPGSRH